MLWVHSLILQKWQCQYRRKEDVRHQTEIYYGGLSGIDTAIRKFENER